jgi:cytoskeletal protein CcmA (bactofilin family)
MAMRSMGWRRLIIGAPEASAAPAPAAGSPLEATPPGDSYVRIERGVEMTGRLVVERPLRIEGEFRGEIESANAVLVSEGGTVEAPIRARTVEIRGAVVGNVVASREVVIHPSGRLHGDVEAPSLVISRGAFFNGRTHMYRPERVAQSDALAAPDAVAPAPAPGR